MYAQIIEWRARQRVGKMAAKLDQDMPGWHRQVTRPINLRSLDDCLLGQIFGSFEAGLDQWSFWHRDGGIGTLNLVGIMLGVNVFNPLLGCSIYERVWRQAVWERKAKDEPTLEDELDRVLLEMGFRPYDYERDGF